MRTPHHLAASIFALTVGLVHADNFGSGGNAFTIDFVTIGNAGNGDDAGAGGGLYSSPYGGVPYVYRMGVHEISQDQITKAVNSGLTVAVLAGAWTGNQPAANVSWYEAAAFVNWLNTSNGHQAAYQLGFDGNWNFLLWDSSDAWQLGGENLYRHKGAYYFLPSEDEWYKAAYHQNNGVTADYWDYATGSNAIPTAVASGTGAGTAVYDGVAASPAEVGNAGGLSAYGTRGQNGNVWEWGESAFAIPNDNSPSEPRVVRGGGRDSNESAQRSSNRVSVNPATETNSLGFRVASVPEPSAAMLLWSGLAAWMLKRRRKSSC